MLESVQRSTTRHSLDGGNKTTKLTLGLSRGGGLTGQRGQLLGNQHDFNFAISTIECRRRYFVNDLRKSDTQERCVATQIVRIYES